MFLSGREFDALKLFRRVTLTGLAFVTALAFAIFLYRVNASTRLIALCTGCAASMVTAEGFRRFSARPHQVRLRIFFRWHYESIYWATCAVGMTMALHWLNAHWQSGWRLRGTQLRLEIVVAGVCLGFVFVALKYLWRLGQYDGEPAWRVCLCAYLWGCWPDQFSRQGLTNASVGVVWLVSFLALSIPSDRLVHRWLNRMEARRKRRGLELEIEVERVMLDLMRIVKWRDVPPEALKELEALGSEAAARSQRAKLAAPEGDYHHDNR